MKKVNSGGELKVNEEEETPFKDKVLGTSKLQEEISNGKEDAKGSTTPKKPEFLRMQSQIALPVVNKCE